MIAQQHCSGIKVLHSDCSGEYLSKAFDKHLAAAGTAWQLTTHDMLQLNSIAEWLNWTLLERIHTLWHVSGLPKTLWGEALHHATWLKNRTATRALDNKTPFEALYRTTPDLSDIQLWGCKVWVHDDKWSKLDTRTCEGWWLGFDINARAHRIFWPSSGTVSVEWDVYFVSAGPLKGEDPYFQIVSSEQTAAPDTPSTSDLASSHVSPIQSLPSLSSPKPVQLCQSTHICKPSHIICNLQSGEGVTSLSPNLHIPSAFIEDPEESGGAWAVKDGLPALLEDFNSMEFVFVAETADAEALKPQMLAEARRRPKWPHWEKAILEELEMLKAAGTWRLENAPPRANIIGSKWVLKAKKDAAGNIVCYKACLVAQGFSQISSVNYNDTYVLVAKLASMHAIIAMANCLGMEMHQIDIKGAYLNSKLNENKVLYMHASSWLQRL